VILIILHAARENEGTRLNEKDGLLFKENEGRRLMKFMEGRRLIEALFGGLVSEVDGLRANNGLDATLVRPFDVLDLTELKTARTLLAGEDLEGLGFNENRGRGRSDRGRGSSSKSTKNPMSPSCDASETLTFTNLSVCCGWDDGRLLRTEDSREKDGRRSMRGAFDDSDSLLSASYTGRGGGGGQIGNAHLFP
jgi:hypothetical protein